MLVVFFRYDLVFFCMCVWVCSVWVWWLVLRLFWVRRWFSSVVLVLKLFLLSMVEIVRSVVVLVSCVFFVFVKECVVILV